jgi:ubiquinol-cytochrome c reductase cytochrome c subunit
LPPHVLAPLTVLPVVVLAVVALAPGRAPAAQTPAARLWRSDCAVCHGAEARGTEDGPSLQGVGEAAVDYELSTGRMPLVVPARRRVVPGTQRIAPDRDPRRHEPAYDADTIAALVRYVGTLIGDRGPPVPTVGAGDVATGGELFRESCAACHSWSGEGGALLHREAPPLHQATPVQVAEAVRVGPGQMPAFGTAAFTEQQVDDVVAYVHELDHPDDRGGLALRHLGPVAEGAVGLLALAVVLLACRWIGDRS